MKLQRFLYLIPAILFTIAIFIMSHQPKPIYIDLGFSFQDKVYHFAAYLAYGLTLVFGISGFFPRIMAKKATWLVLLIGWFYAVSDEIHQYFIPGRECDFFDWLADALGIITAILVFPVLKRYYAELLNKIYNKTV